MAPVPTDLLLLLVLATSIWTTCHARTPNRQIDGYDRSGYYAAKQLVWRGIRSSPGILWFFLFFFACATWASVKHQVAPGGSIRRRRIRRERKQLFADIRQRYFLHRQSRHKHWGIVYGQAWSQSMVDHIDACLIPFLLGVGLFFVTLSVSQLSDAVEAYLLILCSIQLIFDNARGSATVSESHLESTSTLLGFVLSTVVGISMLDSFHPLNVLSFVYAVAAICTFSWWLDPRAALSTRGKLAADIVSAAKGGDLVAERKLKLMMITFSTVISSLHLAFPISAFVVANRVEGSHRKPMLAFLCVAGLHSIFTSWHQYKDMYRMTVPKSELANCNKLVDEITQLVGDRWRGGSLQAAAAASDAANPSGLELQENSASQVLLQGPDRQQGWIAAATQEYDKSRRLTELVNELREIIGITYSWAAWIATSSTTADILVDQNDARV